MPKDETHNPATHTSVGTKHKIKPQYNTKTHKLVTTKGGGVKVVPKSYKGPGYEAEETKKTELVDAVKQVMAREATEAPLKDKHPQASPKRSVSADNAPQTVMDTINKIAKTSKAAKVHGQTVDQTTAIAIQKVMKALTDKNAKKMEETINKDAEGFMGMAKFSLEQIK